MSDTSYKTILDLVKEFPDERSCHQYLASQRWDTGEIICPHDNCGHNQSYVFADGIRYKCKKCKTLFTAKTDTFMEGSKLSTIKWLLAMYLVMHKKGISSVQLAKDIGVTQKTAWFVLQRVRWALGNEDEEPFEGNIQLDETFVGGKNKNRHANKKVK
ncbi:transposase [Pedobacter sp. JCM 36344]|uniref:transposase n=1 Tax=Pedobacter sp. JCM 36344 TaxID=3374280 RepID=UPI0039785CFF